MSFVSPNQHCPSTEVKIVRRRWTVESTDFERDGPIVETRPKYAIQRDSTTNLRLLQTKCYVQHNKYIPYRLKQLAVQQCSIVIYTVWRHHLSLESTVRLFPLPSSQSFYTRLTSSSSSVLLIRHSHHSSLPRAVIPGSRPTSLTIPSDHRPTLPSSLCTAFTARTRIRSYSVNYFRLQFFFVVRPHRSTT